MGKIYKGIARVPKLFGVPMVPLIAFSMLFLLLVLITRNYILALGLIPLFIILKILSYNDEYVFDNIFKKFLFLYKSGGIINYFSTKKTFGTIALSPLVNNNSNDVIRELSKNNLMDYKKHIPYLYHVSDEVILTRNGDYVTTIKINSGLNHITANNETITSEYNYLHNIIKNLANNSNVMIHINNIMYTSELLLNSSYQCNYSKNIDSLYYANNTYNNDDTFISLILKKSEEQDLKEFRNIINGLCSGLKKYNPVVLKLQDDDYIHSQAVDFYNKLLFKDYQKIRLSNNDICNLIGNHRIFIGSDMLQISFNNENIYAQSIEIKDLSEYSWAGFFDKLKELKLRINLTQTFIPIHSQKALDIIEQKRKRLQATSDKGVTQKEQLTIVEDGLIAGEYKIGQYTFNLVVFNEDIKQLKKDTNQVINTLQGLGLVPIISDTNLSCNFFGQLPANYQYRTRITTITSHNFVGFNSLHKTNLGKAFNNSWGEALTILHQYNNYPYYLNLHVNGGNDFGKMNLAHTHINGTSGAGKSVLLNFLFCQLQKYTDVNTFPSDYSNKKATFFMLDKDYSSEANIKALGGQYISIKSGELTGFNLFSLDKTDENIQFIFNIIKNIVTKTETKFTSLHEQELTKAINAVYGMPFDNRSYGISTLCQFLHTSSTEEDICTDLSNRLKEWEDGGKYGWVFDNDTDNFNFDNNINFGIDGTDFLNDKYTSDVISYYILHRITQLLDGRRLVIVIDEFWQWLGSDIFSDFVKDKLKTIRKLNGIIITATQSPSDVINSDIASAVIEQCETKIFLANPEAKYNEYVVNNSTVNFGLTEKEFKLLKQLNKDDRMALIKKSDGSVLVKIDLNLDNNVKFLSCNVNDHNIINQIKAQDADDFVNKFKGKK